MATLVTLDTVKEHLRKTTDEEDTVIGIYRAAAIAYVEKYTSHLLSPQEVTDTFAAWGDYLTLRHQPIAVGDPTPTLVVTYLSVDSDEIEYEDIIIRDQNYPWTIYPNTSFPTLGTNAAVTVTYTAGYAAGEVPDALNAAVLLLCGHWYTHRAAVQEGDFRDVPLAVVSLCRPFRGAVMA